MTGRSRNDEDGASRSIRCDLGAEQGALVRIPQPHGGALLPRGQPGNRGGSGRPPDEFKRLLAALASDEATFGALTAILQDKNHPHFMKALQYCSDRGYPTLARAASAEQVTVAINDERTVLYWRIGGRDIPIR